MYVYVRIIHSRTHAVFVLNDPWNEVLEGKRRNFVVYRANVCVSCEISYRRSLETGFRLNDDVEKEN